MLKIKSIITFSLFLLFSTGVLFSQERFGSSVEMDEDEEQNVPEKKVEPGVQMWYLKGFGAFIDSTSLDTLLDYYHIFHPAYKNSITIGDVGNYATPYQNNDFFGRESNMDFFFLKSREAYLLTPAAIQYYNTRTPYTRLDYSQSENKSRKNETRFNVLHSQNVSPYLNFTFRYDQARSDGQYKEQESKNNFVTLYQSYSKDKLNLHSGFIVSSIQNDENGGLADDLLLLNGIDSDLLDVKLSESHSQFNSTYVFTNGEYRFGKYVNQNDTVKVFNPLVGIMYSFEFQQHQKQFTENEAADSLFFPNTYYGEDYNKDSIRFFNVKNIFQIKQYENANRKTSFGKRAFIGQEFVKISSPGPAADVFSRMTKKYSNVYVGGGIFRETGDFWKWNAEGKFYLIGRNVGQTELSGVISKPIPIFGDSLASLNIKGSIVNLVPDYFQDEFYSNHIRWKNDLKMEQNMTVNGSFIWPEHKFEIGANYAIINNFIYNDTLGVPTQTNNELLILSGYLDKDFNYRNLHFRTRILWQKASDEGLVHLPDFSAFISAYYKFVVSKVLFTQIGTDVRYNTAYYADDYDPSTGLFYLQDDVEVGNFPYIDVYANLRLKRTRFFFKMINIGTGFMDREYYTIPHYPMNRSTFRLGVSWAFYD